MVHDFYFVTSASIFNVLLFPVLFLLPATPTTAGSFALHDSCCSWANGTVAILQLANNSCQAKLDEHDNSNVGSRYSCTVKFILNYFLLLFCATPHSTGKCFAFLLSDNFVKNLVLGSLLIFIVKKWNEKSYKSTNLIHVVDHVRLGWSSVTIKSVLLKTNHGNCDCL